MSTTPETGTDDFSIGPLLFPRMTQLDLTGPFEVFARMPRAAVHLLWKDLRPVATDRGLAITPTATLAECPRLESACRAARARSP